MQFSFNWILFETFPAFPVYNTGVGFRGGIPIHQSRNKFLNNTHFKPFLSLIVWILKVEDEKIIKILTRLNPILDSEICLPFEEKEKASITPNYLKCPHIVIGTVLFFF